MAKYRYHHNSFTATRRRGSLNKNKGMLAVDRIVYLPFDLAAVYAATQNFRIDLAKGLYRSMTVWENVREDYLNEALSYMKEQGSNIFPGDNDEPWIHVRTIGMVALPSERMQILLEVFEILFERDNANLLKGQYFPTPDRVNTDAAIRIHSAKVHNKFGHH